MPKVNKSHDDDSEGSDSKKLPGERNSTEENREIILESLRTSKVVRRLRESVKRRYKFDMFDKKAFPVMERGFSWDAVREECELREADGSSSFTQVLRAGIQVMVNSMYDTVGTSYEQWVHVMPSSKNTELYAPLHGIGFPGEVPENGTYPESGAVGLDIKLKNRKYGQVFAVTEELIEDDQTGQFKNQVKLIAKYLKQVPEVLSMGKLASVAGMKYSSLKVRTSETKPSGEANYPWATAAAPFIGGGFNKPAAFGTLLQANVEAGMTALADQRNKKGLLMGVDPNFILASWKYRFTLAVLLRSALYPSGAAATGDVGGAYAINPIKDLLQPIYSRFMFDNTGKASATSKAWYMGDNTVPAFVVQMRAAAEVVQETPNSGESFNRDVNRFKGRCRLNADFIDPRFYWIGSDGSV